MNYWRCKCGETVSWESGYPPVPCQVCEKCGSTLAMHPDHHREPEPHKWVTRYHESTGKPYEMCEVCFERREKPTNRDEA